MGSDLTSSRRGANARSLLLAFLLMVLSYSAGLGTGYFTFTTPGRAELFEQSGFFNLAAGQEGVVQFPEPYRIAPNVELEVGGFNRTVVSECTPTGFRWKNTGKDDSFNNGRTQWVARGTK